MDAIGIVAEYNPLHGGHVFHMRRSRELTEPDKPVICCMSGTVTQRGELACFSKWARARAAVESGADLVIELPAPYSCASADIFAKSAVHLLNATGVADTLSFGSECGDIGKLKKAADAVKGFDVKSLMSTGMSYPRALSGAADDILSGANNTLGVCYINALEGTGIVPLTVKREGAAHDGLSEGGGYPSASEMRKILFAEGNAEVYYEKHWRLVLAALRGITHEQWRDLEEVSEGLEFRLAAAAREARDLSEFYALVKTKRYTMARIRRIALRGYLGIPCVGFLPPYIRVLAFNTAGAALLKRMKKTAALPVIIKPASYRLLDENCRELFELEVKISDITAMHCDVPLPLGRELRETPYIMR